MDQRQIETRAAAEEILRALVPPYVINYKDRVIHALRDAKASKKVMDIVDALPLGTEDI